MENKFVKINCIFFLFLLMIPSISLAQWNMPNLSAEATTAGLTTNRSFIDILGAAARWIMTILTSVAVVMFVVAGIMYVTAGGNEEQVEKAKKIITYTIIGLVIALVGFLIVEVVSGIASQTETV